VAVKYASAIRAVFKFDALGYGLSLGVDVACKYTALGLSVFLSHYSISTLHSCYGSHDLVDHRLDHGSNGT
jgi:hypothetical protein